MPSGPAYEKLVADLLAGLRKGTALDGYAQGSGSANRFRGASGYRHQIDLSLSGPSELYIFELKCLEKSIGVAQVLVLAGRLADISAAHPNQDVQATMVSLKRPSRNAPSLAAQFKIKLEVVENLQSYGLSFSRHHFVGHVEHLGFSDDMDLEVVRRSGG